MKIKCPKCSTSYKIDASSITSEGVYARCSNCANVFFARKRSEEEIERVRKRSAKRKRSRPKVIQPIAAPAPTMEPESSNSALLDDIERGESEAVDEVSSDDSIEREENLSALDQGQPAREELATELPEESTKEDFDHMFGEGQPEDAITTL